MELRKITELSFHAKKVFLRIDPFNYEKTLGYLLEKGCYVIVAAHMGEPHGHFQESLALEKLGYEISSKFDKDIVFIEDYNKNPIENVLNQLDNKQLIVMENIGFYPGEFDKDPSFLLNLFSGVDYFINDSFSSLDKDYSSVTGFLGKVPNMNAAAGFALLNQFEILRKLKFNPIAPFVTVIGGDDLDQVELIVSGIQMNCNYILLKGLMAAKFFLVEHCVKEFPNFLDSVEYSRISKILSDLKSRRVQIVFPKDFHFTKFQEKGDIVSLSAEELMSFNFNSVAGSIDVGNETVTDYVNYLSKAKTVFCFAKYREAGQGLKVTSDSRMIDTISKETDNFKHSEWIVSDSLVDEAFNLLGISGDYHHSVTGDLALCKYIAGKSLPGLDVLNF